MILNRKDIQSHLENIFGKNSIYLVKHLTDNKGETTTFLEFKVGSSSLALHVAYYRNFKAYVRCEKAPECVTVVEKDDILAVEPFQRYSLLDYTP